MKNYLKTIGISTLLLMILSTVAFAGERGGNGGVSVVCRNKKGNIKSAELLDIYEGREIYGKKYNPEYHFEIEWALRGKLAKYPQFFGQIKYQQRLLPKAIFVPLGNDIILTNDAFPLIKKKGCEFEQLANYTDDGELLISQEIYEELDLFNRAALFIHESIYALRRKFAGDLNSQISRKLVANLLAIDGNMDFVNKIIEETIMMPEGVFYLNGDMDSKINISLTQNGYKLEMHKNSEVNVLSSFITVDYFRKSFKSTDMFGKVHYLVFNGTDLFISEDYDRFRFIIMYSDKLSQFFWKKF